MAHPRDPLKKKKRITIDFLNSFFFFFLFLRNSLPGLVSFYSFILLVIRSRVHRQNGRHSEMHATVCFVRDRAKRKKKNEIETVMAERRTWTRIFVPPSSLSTYNFIRDVYRDWQETRIFIRGNQMGKKKQTVGHGALTKSRKNNEEKKNQVTNFDLQILHPSNLFDV